VNQISARCPLGRAERGKKREGGGILIRELWGQGREILQRAILSHGTGGEGRGREPYRPERMWGRGVEETCFSLVECDAMTEGK